MTVGADCELGAPTCTPEFGHGRGIIVNLLRYSCSHPPAWMRVNVQWVVTHSFCELVFSAVFWYPLSELNPRPDVRVVEHTDK